MYAQADNGGGEAPGGAGSLRTFASRLHQLGALTIYIPLSFIHTMGDLFHLLEVLITSPRTPVPIPSLHLLPRLP